MDREDLVNNLDKLKNQLRNALYKENNIPRFEELVDELDCLVQSYYTGSCSLAIKDYYEDR